MGNSKIKNQMGLIYAAIAVVIFVALVVMVVLLADANDAPDETTTASTSVSTTESTSSVTSDTTTDTTATSDTTTEESTYPPATVPSATSGEGKEDPNPTGELRSLDASLIAKLEAIDNTSRGWGPGTEPDDKNRPIYAVSAQKNYYEKFNASYLMNDEKIYLTFDEGYENGHTEKILDILKDKGVKAVFFITLPYAKSEPELVQRMIDEGHVVGNHSSAHKAFPTLTIEEAYEDVRKLHDYVYENFGGYEMSLFRFPEGTSSDRMAALLKELGYTSVFWSFAHRDWVTDDQPDPAETLEKITSSAHPGAIYLLHAVSKTNTDVLADAIDAFRAKGFELARYPVK